MRTFDADQTAKLLAAAEADGARWHGFFRVALTTGMRLAELTGLRWQDMDLEGGSLTVNQTIQRLPKTPIVVNAPKTAAGRRTIPLGRDVVEALRRHRAAQAEHRLKLGPAWQDYGLVFPSEVGTPVDHVTVRQKFWKLCDAAKVPRIRVHDLRHTAATLMLLAGIHVKVVSERLGHSSIAITLQTYSHVLPTMQRDAADLLDALLKRAPKQASR